MLKDPLHTIITDYLCDYFSTNRLISFLKKESKYSALSEKELRLHAHRELQFLENQNLIQRLSKKGKHNANFRKLFIENDNGELVISKPKIPTPEEIRVLEDYKIELFDLEKFIDNEVKTYHELMAKYPFISPLSEQKINERLLQQELNDTEYRLIDDIVKESYKTLIQERQASRLHVQKMKNNY